jgi:hypothetical protein
MNKIVLTSHYLKATFVRFRGEKVCDARISLLPFSCKFNIEKICLSDCEPTNPSPKMTSCPIFNDFIFHIQMFYLSASDFPLPDPPQL